MEMKDRADLLLMHRALMEARFAKNPSDRVLLGSPRLAEIHSSLVVEIVEAYRSEGKGDEAVGWEKWRELSSDRLEWEAVRHRMSHNPASWDRFAGVEAKRDFLRICFEPFHVADELVDELIEHLDASVRSARRELVDRFFREELDDELRLILRATLEKLSGATYLPLKSLDLSVDLDGGTVTFHDDVAPVLTASLTLAEFTGRLQETA
jgi:hypothetical protein